MDRRFKLMRLVKDYGDFNEDDFFFPDKCQIVPGGYEYMRLVRVPDGTRMTVSISRYQELFEIVDNAVISGDHVYIDTKEGEDVR